MQGVKVVATKINSESYNTLRLVSKKSGIKIYNLLQTVIESYIRYFGTETVITEDLKRVISCFGRLKLTKRSFVLCEPNSNKWKLSRCLAFIKKEDGYSVDHEEAVLIRAPRNGEEDFFMNRNNDDILKAVLQSIDPDVLRNLQTVKKNNDLPSLLDALRFASSETANDQTDIFEREINELFSDNERSEFGTKRNETPYKRHNNRNPETLFNNQSSEEDQTPRRGRPRKNEGSFPEAEPESVFMEVPLQDIEEPEPDRLEIAS